MSARVRTTATPLRYPGGKTRAVQQLLGYVPADAERLVSPFFGGGAFELACADAGLEVVGSDLFEPLVVFWQQVLSAPGAVADQAQRFVPMTPGRFYRMQSSFASFTHDPVLAAAVFFVINRSSFSGLTLSGGASHTSMATPEDVDALRLFSAPGVRVAHSDYEVAMLAHLPPRTLLYCDPPYALGAGSNLYGERGSHHLRFDHLRLHRVLSETPAPWLLSYNDCQLVRELYSDYHIERPSWMYGMSNDNESREVLVVNL